MSCKTDHLCAAALKVLFSTGLFLVLFELACQAYLWRTTVSFEALKHRAGHVFQRSADPVLVYELKKDYDYTTEGRRVHLNHYGLRDDDHAIALAPYRVAILGDSVVFGIQHSQDKTITSMVQQSVDPASKAIKVLNFGVPGYGLREESQFLKDKNPFYRVHQVIYLLNANDFAWRDTRFEGADDGLYRMYSRPLLASSFFVRKLIYRWHKSGSLSLRNEVLVSPGWYKWLYEGNRERGFRVLTDLKDWADRTGVELTIVPLPVGCAYAPDGTFQLDGMFEEIQTFLAAKGIPYVDLRDIFRRGALQYFDSTDHLLESGNRLMADALVEQVKKQPLLSTDGSRRERRRQGDSNAE